ncbi:MAG: TAXI family TRAP transporter solute-binding subunit [Campylobacteraceae bacterium]|nr:TAXI family TRAP transporter solute-binding subunit [Campylobacteraceae bacterium]
MKYKFFTISIPILLLIIASFYVTSKFIKPAPKKEITIASGAITGNYYKTALLYKKLLEKENVKVNLLTSAGSIENIKLLKENKADIAFLQNGTTKENEEGIKSLASIYYEPLWVFYRNEGFPINYVIQLISKKISIGEEGSGTKDLTSKILKDNGIGNTNSTIFNYDDKTAKEELIKGNIDAMFVVSTHKSETIEELLSNPDINVLSFKRAKAYSRKYPFLEALNLYEGTLDLYKNLPDEDINLLSTTATLAVKDGFSEELIRLVLKKIKEVHSKKDLFAKAEQFPNDLNMKLEIHEEAQRYFEYGDTWLEKIFPYWIASNIDRLKLFIIPLLTLLFPLFKGFFPLYTWTMRSKIYRWYGEVKDLDNEIDDLSKEELEKELVTINKLKQEIQKETKVPLSFMGEYYNLQLHLDLIENKIEKKLSS